MASPADGVDCQAAFDVQHGDNVEGHGRGDSGLELTILIHEWVTGGGLACLPLRESWAIEGTAMRRALARDFASIPTIRPRVVITLDRRLPDEPGPWEVVRIGPGEEAATIEALMTRADFTLIIAPET